MVKRDNFPFDKNKRISSQIEREPKTHHSLWTKWKSDTISSVWAVVVASNLTPHRERRISMWPETQTNTCVLKIVSWASKYGPREWISKLRAAHLWSARSKQMLHKLRTFTKTVCTWKCLFWNVFVNMTWIFQYAVAAFCCIHFICYHCYISAIHMKLIVK